MTSVCLTAVAEHECLFKMYLKFIVNILIVSVDRPV